MPPTRRRSGQSATTRPQQSTISFGVRSRVIKPSATSASAKKAKDAKLIADTISTEIASDLTEPSHPPPSEPAPPSVVEHVVEAQAKLETEQSRAGEDERALKITDSDLKRYWKREKKKRKAPQVHVQNLDLEEKILRLFDTSTQYGPCIGIARLKRWRRAYMLNLNPPIEVLAVLLKDENCLRQRAYIDELMTL